MKNAFYHHLRNQLGDGVINRNLIRIFTEYDLLDGERADIAIVKLAPKTSFKGGDYHLKERVDDVLAIIELKYKNGGNREPFRKNIEKVRRYLQHKDFCLCQFYLGFIYESILTQPWLSERECGTYAKGRLTELSIHWQGDKIDSSIKEVIAF